MSLAPAVPVLEVKKVPGKNVRNRNSRSELIDASTGALYEFVLLTLPVALYVALESFVKEDWSYFISSPEWAIATIFLAVQAVTLYFKNLSRVGLGTNGRVLGGLVMLTLIIVVVSSVNAVESLRAHGDGSLAALWVRLALLLFSSAMFFALVGSGRYISLKRRKE